MNEIENLGILKILLKGQGAKINSKNKSGKTALDLAKGAPEILSLLKSSPEKKTDKKNQEISIPKFGEDSLGRFYSKAKEEGKQEDQEEGRSTYPGTPEQVGPHSFNILGLIGKGSFGEVYLVEKKNTKQRFAMKVLEKEQIMKQNLIKYALTERNVLSITNHPFIVRMNFAFQTDTKLFLILDYCSGGDLSMHLQKKKKLPEEVAKMYCAEILLALDNLHRRDIIFRDLKPDNIVLDAEGHAHLTDFGLSKEGVNEASQGAKSFCGSVAYLAPEMLKKKGHGKAVDWYLLGVLFYEMVVGVPPYYARSKEELFENIETEKAPLKIPASLSPEAKSLIKGLLQRNPINRLGSGKDEGDEIKSHEFFKDLDWDAVYNRYYDFVRVFSHFGQAENSKHLPQILRCTKICSRAG